LKSLNTFKSKYAQNRFIKLLTLTLLLFYLAISTQAGTLDPTFGNGGYVSMRVRNSSDVVGKLLIQPDGKILTIGASDLGQSPTTGYRVDSLVIRCNTDGTLDTSFGNGGIVLTDLAASSRLISAVLQPDGKIVAVGAYYGVNQQRDFLVVRYLSNGNLDTSFGNNGIVITDFGLSSGGEQSEVVALLPDGKVIVGGSSLNSIVVARYNENGLLDQTFGTNGSVIVNLDGGSFTRTLIVLSDGKFILACYPFTLVKFMPNGAIDTGFGVDGRIVLPFQNIDMTVQDLMLQPDGKFLIGGGARGYFEHSDYCLSRLNSDGTLDTTFGVNGLAKVDFASNHDSLYRTKLLPNGNIVAVGIADCSHANQSVSYIAIGLYETDGRLKSKTIVKSLGSNLPSALEIQTDGKILVAGHSSPKLFVSRFSNITNDVTPPLIYDFDGDGNTDFGVYRKISGRTSWNIPLSNFTFTPYTLTKEFGLDEDILAPADFDGDGKTDLGVFRPSTGTWWHSWSPGPASDNFRAFQWGLAGDVPVAADYDGDAKADYAVFRPDNGVWYINNSSDGSNRFVKWGLAGDKPLIGDFDGDNKCDVAVWRPSNGVWYVMRSSDNQFTFFQFGVNGDKPVEADYDGDGKTDFAVYRPNEGMWYVWKSVSSSFNAVRWGISTDIPTVGDYDGDGKFDYAVYRQSERLWYVLKSSDNTYFTHQSGDDSYLPIQGN